ncbi:LysR substrate-binding domain-containing protein [Paracoccus laeviglucosivorans]|uniref:LysR family transcriptional regulator, glycine cleavage system transcriptional activator n=1 Tax=Paracoccus laeviglucosivorans TaxID=1197861 RepID=A0A521BIF1_9RHOB|nr:LysR substrate-binding domain-containing protein [Paracoccus laeviglucosivorans]SMO46927.1 LysR family transcriptional regulator, glycine cleavage system transcriptional activator [Paracoccus laeviglucosivorans]
MKLSRSLVPDLSALQTFEAAARHGSFTRAAVELNLTQSAVSRQIKDLEAQLGVALFERVRQRVVLSSAGLRLLPDVEQLIAQIEALTLRAAGSRDVSGHLTIATLPTFGSRWLMPRLPDFLARHPGVQATVVARARPFDLAEAGVDIAIHYGKPVWPGATCAYLCSETLVPVAAPALADMPLGPDMPLLHMESRPMLWAEWLAANGSETLQGFRGHRFDQFTLLIEAALAGLGAGLIPTYLIERELQQGRLRILRDTPLTTDAAYYVVLPEDHVSDPLCNAFSDWICAQVG